MRESKPIIEQLLPVRCVSPEGGQHFFGYYDKCPWDATGRYLLAGQAGFMDRMPRPDDELTLGYIDLQDDERWVPFDTTTAWCWQQGTMLQWLGPAGQHVIYNARESERYVSVIRDVQRGTTRTLPRPVYFVSPDGTWGLSLNFARVNRTRPGYGYEGLPDPTQGQDAPEDEGIYWMDLATGETKHILSLKQITGVQPQDNMVGAEHWFNHLSIAPDGQRFMGLHRWLNPGKPGKDGKKVGRHFTRTFTCAADGSDLYMLSDHDSFSHYAWFDAQRILAWARRHGRGDHYYLFTDQTQESTIIGEDVLTVDGHCTYSPDRQWILTDTYPHPKTRDRTLMLYRLADGQRFDIGHFYAPPEIDGSTRCDLHPRFNRDGTQVCIDSAHEGIRRMYVIDVKDVISRL